ncbi:MAG TPA: hypothetical protein VHW25_05680 [Steroidobacteraceae bacterium]|jgi:hypothetical protein|nr:hypothetical protein [Steroidobacteraceae bacterium]
MKARVYFGTKLAQDRSRMNSVILEIIATVVLAAALGTSHAQGSSERASAHAPTTGAGLKVAGIIPAT